MFLVVFIAVAVFRTSDCGVTVKSPDQPYVKVGDNVTLTWLYNLSGQHASKFNQILLSRYQAANLAQEKVIASSKGIPDEFKEKVSYRSPGSFTLHNLTKYDFNWSYVGEVEFDGLQNVKGKSVTLVLKVDVSTKIRGDGSLVYKEGMELVCDVTGVPHPDVDWYKKGVDSDRLLALKHNVTGSLNYSVSAIPGEYICKASNIFKSSRSTVHLLVPRFASMNFVSACNTALLCCPAYGYPLPAFQWTLPNGQTSNVTEQCFPVDNSTTGTYTCIAENQEGNETVSISYCDKGNVTEVRFTKTYITIAHLEWPEYLKAKFYTIAGKIFGRKDPDYVWTGFANETDVHWTNLRLPKHQKAVTIMFDVIAHTSTSSETFYRIVVYMESSGARSLQDRFLVMVALAVCGLVYSAF